MESMHFTPIQSYPDTRVYMDNWSVSVDPRPPLPEIEALPPRRPPPWCSCADPTSQSASDNNSPTAAYSGTSDCGVCQTKLYSDLDQRLRQIRLLRVFPGSGAETIECEYYIRSLDDQLDYRAVSYTWGSPVASRSIVLNGHDKSVSPTLFSLLEHFRHSRCDQLLWIDALCINQNDNIEKSWHIGIMGEVYSRSHRCLVWLGSGTEFSHVSPAFQLLKDLAEPEKGIFMTSSALLALKKLMALPWWSRMWVVQELVLSRQVTFLCGTEEIEWSTMCSATYFCIAHTDHKRIEPPMGFFNFRIEHVWSNPCQCLDRFRHCKHGDAIDAFTKTVSQLSMLQSKMQGKEANVGFLELICSLRTRRASDPKDYIYAILGLLTKSEDRQKISVDYSQDTVIFYIETAARIMEVDKSLRLLMMRSKLRVGDPLLPTWVLDWRHVPESFSYGHILLKRPCGCSWFKAGKPDLIMETVGNKELVLNGIYYDTILIVGDPWNDHSILLEWAGIAKVSHHWDEGYFERKLLETFHKELRDLNFNDMVKITAYIQGWSRSIQSELPSAADGWVNEPAYGLRQDEEVIREQFNHVVGLCQPVVRFCRTLLCDTMCDETSTAMHEGDAQLARRMYATDLGATFLFITFKALGVSAATMSKVRSFNNIQNTLDLIGIETRRFFITRNGNMGLGPPDARIGDKIFLLAGGSWPFLLRESLSPSTSGSMAYWLVGDSYVEGAMHGEGADSSPDRSWEEVHLI